MKCLVQWLNASNMKEFLFSLCSPTIHPLIDVLVNTLKKLDGNNHQPYYPGKLYKSLLMSLVMFKEGSTISMRG